MAAYSVWLEREVVEASGPEAEVFLQGQASQDLAGMLLGQSRWSWILSPAGKVDALVRCTRRHESSWLLDTDSGFGEPLVGRLGRFKLRTRVDLSLLEWKVLGLRGEDALAVVRDEPGVIAVDASWPGLPGVDLLGPDPVPPPGWPLADAARHEADRIGAGVPRMGFELTDRTIPAETGLVERTVSFTKGCFTGQELVARIDSRGGHVPRHLRRLRSLERLAAGMPLWSGDKQVGDVTSAAEVSGGGWAALGYVHRSVDPPAVVGTVPGQQTVEVEAIWR